MEKCVVCGRPVDPETSSASCNYEVETYYFCSPECRRQFSENPRAFARKAAA